MKDRLLAPELIETFVRIFTEEIAAMRRKAGVVQEQLLRELAGVERRLEGVLKAFEDGASGEALRTRLDHLESERTRLRGQIKSATPISPAVQLHPNAAAIHRAKVADLEETLNDPAIKSEASEALRALIDRVVLTPDQAAPGRLRAELFGDLAEMMVAGAGYHLRRTRLPAHSRR